MKVYTCDSFVGFWPVGTAAVVIAKDETEAAKILSEELEKIGLKQRPGRVLEFKHVKTNVAQAIILRDGDY